MFLTHNDCHKYLILLMKLKSMNDMLTSYNICLLIYLLYWKSENLELKLECLGALGGLNRFLYRYGIILIMWLLLVCNVIKLAMLTFNLTIDTTPYTTNPAIHPHPHNLSTLSHTQQRQPCLQTWQESNNLLFKYQNKIDFLHKINQKLQQILIIYFFVALLIKEHCFIHFHFKFIIHRCNIFIRAFLHVGGVLDFLWRICFGVGLMSGSKILSAGLGGWVQGLGRVRIIREIRVIFKIVIAILLAIIVTKWLFLYCSN